VISEQSFGLTLDSGLLVADVTAGKPLESAELMSLAAAATALYVSVALESRTLGSVDKCRDLWAEAAGLFDELHNSWTGIESDDPNIHWLRGRLEHYQLICEDRTSLYTITEKERLLHAKGKESEMSDPEPVREFSRVETPHRYGRQYGRWNVVRKAAD
jgi:hypothetical protein